MISPIAYPKGDGIIVIVKPDRGEEEFFFFEKLATHRELCLLEEYFLIKAHEVDFKYEEHVKDQLIERTIECFEDINKAECSKTCQGVIIKAYTIIDNNKLTKEWTCKNCNGRNQKLDLNCRVCKNFITLSNQVKKITRKIY